MGKNCYEKEKLPLDKSNDISNILFFCKLKSNRYKMLNKNRMI